MIGSIFGRYTIVQKLGQGGMGEVWLAHDASLDRRVALKFPSASLDQDPTARKRFLKEARSAAALDHPYICSIHEVDEVDGRLFSAMEYVPGETLKDAIAGRKLSLPMILTITSEIAQALVHAHGQGIVHRDLKPANIMLASNGHVKVMDFGLAKRIPTSSNMEAQATTASTSGQRYGTLAYMSPEQIRDEEADPRSDIFSLGLILYEMLTGKHPFARGTPVETASAILNDIAPAVSQTRKDVSHSLDRILSKMLAKKRADRYASAAELGVDLAAEAPSQFARRGRRAQVVAAVVLIAIAAVGAFGLNSWARRNGRIRWARDEAIPKIAELASQEDYSGAFKLLKEARLVIPGDEKLESLWADLSTEISIKTDPPGADVYVKDYLDTGGEWERLGTTPFEKARVARGFKRFKTEKAGFEVIERALSITAPVNMDLRLDANGSVPSGMVRVPESNAAPALTGIDPIERIQIDTFLIDRYEVTNKEYKKFVDAGGYQKSEFWKEPFVKDGRTLTFDQAMVGFRDATGRPGPATWELGDYPKAQDDSPVSGVSWYEAAAFAEFSGKRLPSVYHWVRAAGTQTAKYLLPVSRFGGSGPGVVTESQSLTVGGAYDMAGNVREWVSNPSGGQRYILGCAWSDQRYLFNFAQVASPFDRSPGNGFRTAKYESALRPDILGPIEFTARDYSKEKPVSDEIFQIYKQQFAYDKMPLDAKVEAKDESNEHWTTEKVTFRAAYGDERVIAYLAIPKGAKPPYQTVVRFPGSNAITDSRLENPGGFDFFVRSGRVLVSVVYKGTYERQDGMDSTWPNTSHGYSEYVIKWVKDFKRTVDYLETRNDIDMKRLAYLGTSWGGRMGAIIPAVDDRPRVSVIFLGGLAAGKARPEVDQINFISHVKIPVLMLNGKYDSLEPVTTAQLPMFKMWGTREADKRHVIYESNGHSVPRNETIKETLDWLDKYLGHTK